MKYIQTKKIIVIVLSIFVFIPIAFIHAETVEINGITFVVGKHEPKKRVYKAPRKYKNPKALEVHKQPAHGRKLKLEETEEYIEAHNNDIVVNNDINVNLPKTLEDFQLQKSEKGTLINKVVSSIIDVLKKILSQVISLQKNIFNFSERLSLIEKKLGIKSQNNLTNNNQAPQSDSDESTQDESTQDESTQDESTQDESTQDESTQQQDETIDTQDLTNNANIQEEVEGDSGNEESVSEESDIQNENQDNISEGNNINEITSDTEAPETSSESESQ